MRSCRVSILHLAVLFGIMQIFSCQEVAETQQTWTTIGRSKYQVVSMDKFYAFSTTNAGSEFRLLPVAELPQNKKFRAITSLIDQYCLLIGISIRCHKQTAEGIEFDSKCCERHDTRATYCSNSLPKLIDEDLSNYFSETRELEGKEIFVRDAEGKQYIVLTTVKVPECPSIQGTEYFPKEPVPYGIRVQAGPENRLLVLIKCYATAAAVLLPLFYLVDIKSYWKEATTLI